MTCLHNGGASCSAARSHSVSWPLKCTQRHTMWNRRAEEETPARPQAEPARREFPAAPTAVPPRPVPVPQPREVAVIGASMRIKGEIRSQEELYIDGEVEGSLETGHCLTVGPNGKVKANIKARQVTIFGNVKGNVEVSEKIAIRQNGSLIGDIRTAGIMIDDGSYFKGSIDIIRPERAASTA